MDRLMWNVSEFQRLYNCSFYNVDSIPLQDRRNIPMGLVEMTLSLVGLVLYIPCVLSIWRRRAHCCHKIMFVMGCFDMAMLILITIGGLFHCLGVVYCSSQTLMYILGSTIMAVYIVETQLELMLAVNRCAYFLVPEFALRYFSEGDPRTWSWTVHPVLIGAMYFLFGQPAPYSGIMGQWSLNPHYGYTTGLVEMYTMDWRSYGHYFNAFIICFFMPTIYFAFYLSILNETRRSPENKSECYLKPKGIFYQVLIISVLNFGHSSLALLLNIFTIRGVVFDILCHFSFWSLIGIHGAPPVIYLLFNKKIQKDVKRMITKKCLKSK